MHTVPAERLSIHFFCCPDSCPCTTHSKKAISIFGSCRVNLLICLGGAFVIEVPSNMESKDCQISSSRWVLDVIQQLIKLGRASDILTHSEKIFIKSLKQSQGFNTKTTYQCSPQSDEWLLRQMVRPRSWDTHPVSWSLSVMKIFSCKNMLYHTCTFSGGKERRV